MKRILVPLDGSEFAERAIEPALALAKRHGAELHLASVVSDLPPVPLASGDGELVSRWFDEEKARAEEYLGGVKGRISSSDIAVSTHARVGPVTRSIDELGRELDVDLITLTTHGRGAWQRAWLGSVADQLLRSSQIPLLLLREDPGRRIPFEDAAYPGHVLVPLDGSEAGEAVLAVLRAILPPGGGRVTLVAVLHQPFPLATTYLPHAVTEESLMAERRGQLESYLGGIEERLTASGPGRVEARVLVGDDAATSLLELADKEGVDLIALSTRGRGGVARFFMGSVADKLVRGAKVPLLTARRPPEEEED